MDEKKKTESRKTKQATGPRTLRGSRTAKRQAVVLLEVLSGLRGPQEGSEALSISLNRYYQLETRALQGFISALEPRPRGKQRTPESEIEHLRLEKDRLGRELSRNQALLRAAQRSLGLPRARAEALDSGRVSGKVKTNKKGKRRSRTVRARKAISVLRRSLGPETPPASQPAASAAS